jgi:hypothetical protein
MRFCLILAWLFSVSLAIAQDTAPTAASDTTSSPYDNIKDDKMLIMGYDSLVLSIDSTSITPRSFDEAAVDELRKNDDFNYRQPPTVVESLWDRFLLWLGRLLEWLFRGAVTTNWGRVMLYALGLVVLIVVIMMLLKVDALRVFQSGADKGAVAYRTFTENIHEMDFDRLIRDAIAKKEYRIGVRLTFLHALKILADRQHVDWRPGKTNHDYLAELKEGELKTGFNELSFYFDYTWYGDFNVTENLFQKVSVVFDGWRKKIE